MSDRAAVKELEHDGWTIRIIDDQPIAEGKTVAAMVSVELLRDSRVVIQTAYPAYRQYTLLAHWTDTLGDLCKESADGLHQVTQGSCDLCGEKNLG